MEHTGYACWLKSASVESAVGCVAQPRTRWADYAGYACLLHGAFKIRAGYSWLLLFFSKYRLFIYVSALLIALNNVPLTD